MISIVVLTKNEEQDLLGCLQSVSWSDDIHVYDSYSTDSTVSIAENFGAKVTQRQFDNWAAHQNWGLQNLKFKHPWVFYIDADERVTHKLRDQLLETVKGSGSAVAYRVQRRDFFLDTWLKHVQTTPFYIRLFRPEYIRYERLVNPVTLVDGETAEVRGYLDHFPFSKGMDHWLARHNSYSALEAKQIVTNANAGGEFSLWLAFFGGAISIRRYHQKELFYRLPMRPLIKFVALYFLKAGFLDGRAGFTYAVLQGFYEYMIVLKGDEIRRASR